MKHSFQSLVDRRLASMRWTPEMQNQTAAKMKTNLPIKKRVSFALIVCIALLSVSIAALAYTLPGILRRLYTNADEVGQRQIEMVQPIAVSKTVRGVIISIDEAIYDGQRIAVYWTIENTNERPVLVAQEQGCTFNKQPLYPDFSSMGVYEGQVILPGEILDGGFISIAGYPSAGMTDSVQLRFQLFSLLRPVELLSRDTEASDTQYARQVQQRYQSGSCIVVNAETREIAIDPSLDPGDFDTESAAAFTNEYEMYGLVEKLDELVVGFSVDSSAVAAYSDISFEQTMFSEAYPVTLSTVTLSPVTTYFAFTIESKTGFNQKEAVNFCAAIAIDYCSGDGTALDFLNGDYMGDSSIVQNNSGEYSIIREYPLPGLQQIPDKIIVRLRFRPTDEIICEYIIYT